MPAQQYTAESNYFTRLMNLMYCTNINVRRYAVNSSTSWNIRKSFMRIAGDEEDEEDAAIENRRLYGFPGR